MRDNERMLSVRYALDECVILPRRLLQARARQKGWTNVRIFGSVESRGMSHVGIPLRMIAFETTLVCSLTTSKWFLYFKLVKGTYY